MTGKDYSNLIKFFNCTSDDLFKNDFDTYNKYVFGGKLKSEDEVRIADAILDRIVNTSHRIKLEGESLRKGKLNINR